MTFHLPTVAEDSIMTRSTRIARAVKNGARHAQQAQEHRTLAQLRVDMAALVLKGQDLLVNSYTRSAATFSSPNTTGPGASYSGTARPGSTNPVRGPSDDPDNDSSWSPGFGGVLNGLVEGPGQEYLNQLEELKRGVVVAGPSGGPVPIEIARELLAGSSTFLRVLTDPVTGEILPVSPDRYTLREAEREVLRAMVGRC
ncbi:hypothetical protein [Arthrobacter alpinus]|uniref:hypothetical protein n=1 Tax=Arthrobacter alpinus TaxID=656366 RepID=UPI0012FF4700|nr:hypothetical protein [Arthrobacter alpinus]